MVLLDIWLEGSKLDGLEVLDQIRQTRPEVPVIVISGHGTIETAVKAIKKGAYDFLEKPFNADRLLLLIERARESTRLKRENAELKLKLGDDRELIGRSSAMQQVRNAIQRVAPDRQPGADHRSPRRRQGGRGAPDPRQLAGAPRRRSW